MSEPSARDATRQVLDLYEEVTYDGLADPRIAVNRVMGIGALYGCDAEPRDVLDLGCGTGAVLNAAGLETSGRLVGVEMSERYCRDAKARCEPFGDRAEIICSDVLNLKPGDLGEFDLIYLEGVLYVLPPDARRHVLGLAAACLRPGGVAVISYYNGPLHSMRVELHRLLRARRSEGLDAAAAVAEARELMRVIQEGAMPNGLLRKAIEATAKIVDANFFHEVMNPNIETFRTVELEASLAKMGLGFLNYIGPSTVGALATSAERALEASIRDLESGNYHRALFGRCRTSEQATNLRAAGVIWETSLVRTAGTRPYFEIGHFVDRNTGAKATVPNSLIQALVDELAVDGRSLTDGLANARERLSSSGCAWNDAYETSLERGLLTLWDARVITPRRMF